MSTWFLSEYQNSVQKRLKLDACKCPQSSMTNMEYILETFFFVGLRGKGLFF